MKKVWACLSLGFIILVAGIYAAVFLTTTWVVVGMLLAVFGGTLMGGSSYFLPKAIRK